MITLLLALLLVPASPAAVAASDGEPPPGSPAVSHEAPAPPLGLEGFPASALAAQLALEDALTDGVSTARLRAAHDELAGRAHVAGTPGDRAVVDAIARAFEAAGLTVERHAFWAWLPIAKRGELWLVTPEERSLPVQERALDEDPDASDPDLTFGWNAYSGDGDVTAGVVYANRGTQADFERLRELGVDCGGKIVIARYGGNYRGYKAKYAEEAGAAGLVIYTDPKDSGWGRGLAYPEGGWANETSIQRGSIKTIPYFGDPLTPFVEATEDAARLDPRAVALPTIPVQPVGWGAAQEILARMRGPEAPSDWQGGLPFRYRLTGGDELSVRVVVEQERKLVETWNVLGTLAGSRWPEKKVILGGHHDAWNHGAADPTCGTICTVEAAHLFGELARKGQRPLRSLVFAAWGAEEFGIIGSVEWVEANLDDLRANAIGYLNLDMAATGLNLSSSASPSIQRALAGAAARVSDPLGPPGSSGEGGASALDGWLARRPGSDGLPRFGSLGGGSDHVGFLALGAIAAAGIGAHGSPGSSYHSNYDTLAWYRKVVGDDYESARLVTRVTALTAARLAYAPLVPLDPRRFAPETLRHLRSLTTRGRATGLFEAGQREIAIELAHLEAAALQFGQLARRVTAKLEAAVRTGGIGSDDERLAAINDHLLALDRAWWHPGGVPGRPWFQNLFAATDETSGYAAWMLPALRWAVEYVEPAALEHALELYLGVFERMTSELEQVDGALG